MIKVFLAGEGRCELGSRDGHAAYQSDAEPGVLQGLLKAIHGDGWAVVGAVSWKNLKKLRVNAPDRGDARNVHAASMHAAENGADVLVFARDRDHEMTREAEVERAIEEASRDHRVTIAGGVAVENLEGWLLAIGGETKSESIRHPEKEMARIGLVEKNAPAYVAHIEKHGITRVPKDAESLGQWIERAREALTSTRERAKP